MLTPSEIERLRRSAQELNAYGKMAFAPRALTKEALEALRASLPEKDRHRLRQDGKLEPELPPMTLCGGMESPYTVAPTSAETTSMPTSREQDQ